MSLSAEQQRAVERAIGHQFRDPSLLNQALKHRSAGSTNNERLEFLGDSIVNHIVAEAIYRRFPNASEGEMSRHRASLVKGDTLAIIAREMALGNFIQLGLGERKSGGHQRASILADALEAIAGAILLDSDFERVKQVVTEWFQSRLNDNADHATSKDPKTQLQEILQGRGLPLPEYDLITTRGEDHQKVFVVECRVPALTLCETSSASSRRRAEQGAAQKVLERVR